MRGLFIFRRDFRIRDNTALNELATQCNEIHTIFIFTPEQIGAANKFKSDRCVAFMIDCLEKLDKALHEKGGKLFTYHAHNVEIIEEFIKRCKIDIVGFNLDITPYARERDKSIMKLCESMRIKTCCAADYYLNEPGTIMRSNGEPYKKFTPYYNVAITKKFREPKTTLAKFANTNSCEASRISLDSAKREFVKEGAQLEGKVNELSAYIKFGFISIREAYKTKKNDDEFVRKLIWRDFYANILYLFPSVLNKPMIEKYEKIKWSDDRSALRKWCEGKTGFPIVDAGMRELNSTGIINNRNRMIVASFLVKVLHINWLYGQQYFAKHLIDYDPASNNGNWQWIASTGVDSQPYFRMFNPWLQHKKFDKDCAYVKKWIPELSDVPARDILKWHDKHSEYNVYIAPIVDYDIQKEITNKKWNI
jgi:deoxyribodipyrimidine photo-lyase